MNKFTNKKYYIALFVIVIITIGALAFEIENIQIKKSSPLAPLHSNGEGNGSFASKSEVNSFITLVIGNINTKLVIVPNQTLYDVLVGAKKSGQIEFSGKNYPGLGFLVTDIGTLHSGDGKYLFYYINNKEASVGVSSYLLKDGDIIEWKLK